MSIHMPIGRQGDFAIDRLDSAVSIYILIGIKNDIPASLDSLFSCHIVASLQVDRTALDISVDGILDI